MGPQLCHPQQPQGTWPLKEGVRGNLLHHPSLWGPWTGCNIWPEGRWNPIHAMEQGCVHSASQGTGGFRTRTGSGTLGTAAGTPLPSIPHTLPGSWEAAGTNRTKSPSSSCRGGHLWQGESKVLPKPSAGSALTPSAPGHSGSWEIPMVPVPLGSRQHTSTLQPQQHRFIGVSLKLSPGGSAVPAVLVRVHRCPPAQPAPLFSRYRCPRRPATIPRCPQPRRLRCSRGTGAPQPQRLRGLSPCQSRQLRGPGAPQPRGPATHLGRMVPARCRQRGSARRGRGAGRGREGRGEEGRGGPARAGGGAGGGSARPQPPGLHLRWAPAAGRDSGTPPGAFGLCASPSAAGVRGNTARLPEEHLLAKEHPLPGAPGSTLGPKGHRQPGSAPALPAPPSPWVSAGRPGQVSKEGVNQRAELVSPSFTYLSPRGTRKGRSHLGTPCPPLLAIPYPNSLSPLPAVCGGFGNPTSVLCHSGCSCNEPGTPAGWGIWRSLDTIPGKPLPED